MDAVGGGTAGTAGPQSPAFGSISNATVTIVYGGKPLAYSLKTAWVPLATNVADPSRLLRARAEIVPYLDPAGHVDVLRHWITTPEPFSVRVIGGRGGAGKTRLAVELCRAAAQEDWLTGLLGPQPTPVDHFIGDGDTSTALPGMLVVIDYAETRTIELETLLPALQQAASPERRIRVLLLVRRAPRATDWTDALRTGHDELDAILDTADGHQVVLEEAAWTIKDREDLFRNSYEAFAGRLEDQDGTCPVVAPPQPDLTAARFGNPLLVAATAYLAAHNPGRTLPDTWEGLLDGILNHEASHWKRSADRPEDPDGTVTRRVAALAALAGADTETEGAALLHHVPDLQDATIGVRMAWARWYHRIYPGPRFWNPLEPDLLGEHLTASTLTEFPPTLAAAVDPGRGPNVAQPLIVIARIATTSQTTDVYPGFSAAAAHALQNVLPQLTRAAVDEAVDPGTGLPAGPTIASALAQTVNTLTQHLDEITESLTALPQRSVPHVNPLAATLLRHHASWLRSPRCESVNITPMLAAALNDLAGRLRLTGDRDGAVHAIREAVDIRRSLAEADPAAYSTGLAMSLNNLSNCLSTTGDHDGALKAIREAVDIRLDLVDADPGTHNPNLAIALNNLSTCLAHTGDHVGAQQVIHQAIKIRRDLAKADPDTHNPNLASSLNNLASYLAGMGDQVGALDVVNEATNLYQNLARTNPAVYNTDLATALSNLSNCLATIGDQAGALRAIREAVDIRRSLAKAYPAAYTSDLASSLNNLSNRLTDVGDREGAIDTIREATSLYGGLADAHPAAYAPYLAKLLHNTAVCLVDTNELDEALDAVREAVKICRELADAHPSAYTSNLAYSLLLQAAVLDELGHYTKAVASREEAERIRAAGL